MATNEKNTPASTATQGASSSARRRRRRSHHGGTSQAQNGGQNGEKTAAAQPKKQAGNKGAASASRQTSQSQGRRQNGRGAAPAKNAPAKSGPEPRSHRTPEPRRRASVPQEEDPGLVLITRRPPKQKFANFEEYIAAHGGVTAPIPGAEETDPIDGAERDR